MCVTAAGAMVFLDASSGEPLLPEARDAWVGAQAAGWGDPLRLHRPGRLAAAALDTACEIVAAAVGARPDEVVFPGSGAAAATAAVHGLVRGRARVGRTVVTSAVEHSAILGAAAAYGDPVTVPVDASGRVDLAAWIAAVQTPGVACACLQVANQEVGTLQPYRRAAEACVAAGVPMVLDAGTALGRLNLHDSGPWAVLTGAALGYGGPASVGILILRRSARWRAPYPVDDYQGGRWPGPPDVPAIVAAAVALEVWRHDAADVERQQRPLIDRLRVEIPTRVPDVEVVGDPARRVPHLLTFSVLYVDGESLTVELDRAGFAVASGSACSAISETPSHVLAAMGALTHGNVRIGLARGTVSADVDRLLGALPPIVAELRTRLGAP